jgi:hypothetical protein
MKFTALLLAVYISFLMSQPSLVTINTSSSLAKKTSHRCCAPKKEAKQDRKDQSKNKCANGMCNPFGECPCCLGLSSEPVYQFFSYVSMEELIASPSAHLFSNYLADCFHPPEIV